MGYIVVYVTESRFVLDRLQESINRSTINLTTCHRRSGDGDISRPRGPIDPILFTTSSYRQDVHDLIFSFFPIDSAVELRRSTSVMSSRHGWVDDFRRFVESHKKSVTGWLEIPFT